MTRFDNHSEVFYLVGGELAFFKFQVEVKFSHTLENAFGAFFVESGIGGVDEKIVHIDDEPSFGDHIAKRVVHEPLKGGGGVGKPEEHYGGFEESLMGDEGCFPLVTVLNSHVVVPPPDVKLSEYLGVS